MQYYVISNINKTQNRTEKAQYNQLLDNIEFFFCINKFQLMHDIRRK
jgi:hypothetical protein